MTLRIRLSKPAKSAKKDYNFRVIVIDSRKPRDSRSLEELGFYNPAKKPSYLKLNIERIDYWLKAGALPSETVASLIRKVKKNIK